MHLVFLSTLYEPPWGGSENLWSGAAMCALEQGHRVSVFVSEREKLETPLERLKAAGAKLYFWKPKYLPLNFLQRIVKKLSGRKLPQWEWWHRNIPQDADAICVSQGGVFCALKFHGLAESVESSNRPYVLLARCDTGIEFFNERTRARMKEFFEKAAAFVTASQSTIDQLRLYLPSKLENARVLHSPLADYAAAEPRAGDRRSEIGDRGADGGEDLTTEDTIEHLGRCEKEQPKVGPKGEGVGTSESKCTEDRFVQKQGSAWASQAGGSESDSLASELADSPASESPISSANTPASLPATSHSLPAAAPEAQVIEMACVGRLRAGDKGQHLLLAALAEEPWRSRSYRLSFYGEGPDRKYLEELVEFYGLGEKVHFAGHTKDVGEIWRRSHLAVQPSFVEGAPQSLLEAMLCRRPCVATAVSGIPEWVEEGKTGFLAEAPTVHHLRLALERAWENRHRWREMAEAAREACLAKRDPDPAGTLLGLLREAAGASKAETLNPCQRAVAGKTAKGSHEVAR
jgi:glycosyltransferase involved in cell wall biosynthesis